MSGARALEDDDRCGRNATTVTSEHVSGVEFLIKDPKMTYAEIQDIMKVAGYQQSAVWVFSDENPPVKFKINRSVSKQMIVSFCAKFGQVATMPLEDRKTITADWYVNHCLPKVFQARCKRRPRTGVCGLLLHHDNTSSHTAAVTLDFLATNDVQLVTHPP